MKTVVAFLGLALAGAPAQTLRSAAESHHVLIGAAVDTRSLSDPAYASLVAQQFNMIEAENEMKWTATEPQQGSFRFEAGDKLVDFAQAHGMQLRGHNLCWHSYNPAWLAKGKFTPAELSAMLEKHIATVVSHFAGKVFAWDVVNEALDSRRQDARLDLVRARIYRSDISLGACGRSAGAAFLQRLQRGRRAS